MFGIKFNVWPTQRKLPGGGGSVGDMQDRVAMTEGVRQDFVDTHPAATYLVAAEQRQAEQQPADRA